MEYFNIFGLVFVVALMIPNIVYAIKRKDDFKNKEKNKLIEITEQVGRYGCMGFMIIDIPGTYFNTISNNTLIAYIAVNAVLVALYYTIWIIYFKKNCMFKAMTLSIVPSALFLFDGIIKCSVLLIISAVLFAVGHITLSYKNAKQTK